VAGPQVALDAIARDQLLATAGALHLVQALAGVCDGAPPRLWLVTRGAQAAEAGDTVPAPTQATVWGLGGSVVLEHPEFQCRRIDLAPDLVDDEADLLARELLAADAEDQVALRRSGRLAARLVRLRLPAPPAAGPTYRLDTPSRGSLDGLTVLPAGRSAPGPGQVEIEVHATGLNFRDVLNAMGLYPGAPPAFGSECAGRVTAVGEGVRHLRVGDEVCAVAPGAFGSHVVADARMVAPRPAGIPTEQAAGLLVAFVTAVFALRDVGRLAAGERVLIHAAAGGVGLAAVQIAQAVGAEVFATAGSPAKRAYLAARGVRRVMDSRSLSFTDEVLAATGGAGVHVVLNSLSGEAIGRSLEALGRGGRFLEIGKRDIWTAERVTRVRPDVRYEILDWGQTAGEDPERIGRLLDQVAAELADGRLRALPCRVFDLAQVGDAFRLMAQGRHLGKVVVRHPAGATADPMVRVDGTYLITGGMGGIGLRAATWLVERGARHVVLTGRRAPGPEAAEAIAGMERVGARVMAAAADAADGERMTALLEDVRRQFPPLRGVIHSAGVLDDGILTQQDWGRFRRVLAPKLDGGILLHRLTLADPLDFFVLYSSAAAVLGSPGQANHAAANAFLDALAAHRRAAGLPGLSVNWGPWADVGAAVRHDVGGRAGQEGLGRIAPERGLAVLDRFARGGRARLASLVTVARPRPAKTSAQQGLLERLEATPAAGRLHLLREHIQTLAARVLGLDGMQVMDGRRPLQEVGLDSLMAVELRNALSGAVGRPLPATLLFDYPTVDALVAHLGDAVLGLGAAAEEPVAEGGGVAAGGVLGRIEDLSDEEVERVLADKMRRQGR
jgi:NADPH:quinone reductase-like Zn-dependent oxidoreductase/acyl carrier protein